MERVSISQYIEKGLEDTITDFTQDSKCSQCGACCTRFLYLSNKEKDRIKRYIKEHNIKRAYKAPIIVRNAIDMTCPFRDNEKNICSIYEVRPKACRGFMCNKEKESKELRELLSKTLKCTDMMQFFE